MTPIVYIPDKYLLVLDEQSWYLKDEEWIYREWYPPTGNYKKEVTRYRGDMGSTVAKRILAHIPLNNAPLLDGVDLLPELGKKCSLCEGTGYYGGYKSECPICNGKGWVKDSPAKYTEDDLMNAFYAARSQTSRVDYEYDSFEAYLHSLSTPKIPIGFEPKKEDEIQEGKYGKVRCINCKIRTIPNEQDIPVWQGRYIYKTE